MKRLLLVLATTFCCIGVNAQKTSYVQQLDEKYTSGLFRGSDAYFFVPMDEPNASSYYDVFQYLQGKVPGLQIISNRFMRPVIRYRGGYPALFLDEMRVDARSLASVNINDVALIKVFRPPFAGAFGGGAGGAIAVYTKEGDEEGTE